MKEKKKKRKKLFPTGSRKPPLSRGVPTEPCTMQQVPPAEDRRAADPVELKPAAPSRRDAA